MVGKRDRLHPPTHPPTQRHWERARSGALRAHPNGIYSKVISSFVSAPWPRWESVRGRNEEGEGIAQEQGEELGGQGKERSTVVPPVNVGALSWEKDFPVQLLGSSCEQSGPLISVQA